MITFTGIRVNLDSTAPIVPLNSIVEHTCVVELADGMDPFRDIDLVAIVTDPEGDCRRLPMFWKGGREYAFRWPSAREGRHTFEVKIERGSGTIEKGGSGTFDAVSRAGEETPALLRRGALKISANGRYLEHADGTPFFWLADSWWFGMCKRLGFPEEFEMLASDRAGKGFTAIQFAIGFACDIEPFDPRDMNEAGHIWEPDFKRINPAYFDQTDERIECLLRHGLVPNIVGMWGYYIEFMGAECAKRHWRYLIARYSAYPVVWTLCGEVRLLWYADKTRQEERLAAQRAGWTKVARMIRQEDPFHRLLTCHVGPKPSGYEAPPLDDPSLLDFHFLQPGHSDHDGVESTLRDFAYTQEIHPNEIILVGECCFEGMHGGTGPKVQRNLFWASVLSGMPGYSYGVDAIWQMNRREEPFGPSVPGHIWGNTPWDEACHWEGSANLGLGARILSTLDWWNMEPHPEWIEPRAGNANRPRDPFIAGVPGRWRLLYFPRSIPSWANDCRVVGLENDAPCHAEFISPIDGQRFDLGVVMVDESGGWNVPSAPILHDWLLLLRREDA